MQDGRRFLSHLYGSILLYMLHSKSIYIFRTIFSHRTCRFSFARPKTMLEQERRLWMWMSKANSLLVAYSHLQPLDGLTWFYHIPTRNLYATKICWFQSLFMQMFDFPGLLSMLAVILHVHCSDVHRSLNY